MALYRVILSKIINGPAHDVTLLNTMGFKCIYLPVGRTNFEPLKPKPRMIQLFTYSYLPDSILTMKSKGLTNKTLLKIPNKTLSTNIHFIKKG